MERFKLKVGLSPSYPINTSTFLKMTGKRPPYCMVSADGTEHLYAVCPACNNPIQIVGLYRNTLENGTRPYGRHNRSSIPGLAEYHEQWYLDCPYSNRNWRRPIGLRRADDPRSEAVRDLLLHHFDAIIDRIELDTGLHISHRTAEQMLRICIANNVWRYRTARENNLPWVMAEADRGRPLFRHWIKAESELADALRQRCPELSLEPIENQPDKLSVESSGSDFVNISYYFTDHRFLRGEDGEEMSEQITFRVIQGKAEDGRIIFEKTIFVDTDAFVLRCLSSQRKSSRSRRLLELAAKMLNP